MQRDFLLGTWSAAFIASVGLFVTGKVATRPSFPSLAQSDKLNL
jgi:hypothetical protein